MYLPRRDFGKHGYTDGCVGCRSIASGVQGRTGVPHSKECRRRMVGIVQEQKPEIWARHVRRNGEPTVHEEAETVLNAPLGSGSGPAARDQEGDAVPPARDEEQYLFGYDSDEDDRPSHPAFSEDEGMGSENRAGTVTVQNQWGDGSASGTELPEEISGSLTGRLCRVDCEVFSPPRAGPRR